MLPVELKIKNEATVETLEKGVKYVQLWNKDTRTSSISTFWCLYCQLWTYFTPCSDVSVLNFEYVIVGRDKMTFRYLENTF